ncbi:MAG: hypothetical protein LBH44_03680 [Treponema sp.]|nr:hypothetical protein [Treponema sp.]
MKKFILLALLFTVFSGLSAQQMVKGPAINSDVMGYFQDEMTSLVQFQKSASWKDDDEELGISPFIISYRYRGISLIDTKELNERSLDYDRTASNSIHNGLIGMQFKITDNLYLPLFACFSNFSFGGMYDDETLYFEDNPIYTTIFADGLTHSVESYFFASGIVLNYTDFYLGVFAGYYLETYKTEIKGEYRPIGTVKWYDMKDFHFENEGTNHSFRIALVPDIKTSDWKYIGNVLNKVFGYIGIGNNVDVYAGEEKNSFEDISGLLNFGLNLFFNRIEIGEFYINPNLYYTRNSYDSLAKNEDFGLSLALPFVYGIWDSEGALFVNFGYRNFYSVSPYFVSHYSSNLFIDIGLSFKRRWYLCYSYDDVRHNQLSILFDVRDVFTALGEVGLNIYKEVYEKKALSYGAGARYRFPRNK